MPRNAEWERDGIVPRGCSPRPAPPASSAWTSPEEYGGGGVDDFRYNLILGEEVQRAGTGGAGLGLTLHNDICLPYFLSLTTDEQKARWLPGICSGELITAIAMTEPGIGSDLAVDDAPRPSATATTTSSTARRRSSPTASTPTSSSPR